VNLRDLREGLSGFEARQRQHGRINALLHGIQHLGFGLAGGKSEIVFSARGVEIPNSEFRIQNFVFIRP
jgi:hypothetical protein